MELNFNLLRNMLFGTQNFNSGPPVLRAMVANAPPIEDASVDDTPPPLTRASSFCEPTALQTTEALSATRFLGPAGGNLSFPIGSGILPLGGSAMTALMQLQMNQNLIGESASRNEGTSQKEELMEVMSDSASARSREMLRAVLERERQSQAAALPPIWVTEASSPVSPPILPAASELHLPLRPGTHIGIVPERQNATVVTPSPQTSEEAVKKDQPKPPQDSPGAFVESPAAAPVLPTVEAPTQCGSNSRFSMASIMIEEDLRASIGARVDSCEFENEVTKDHIFTANPLDNLAQNGINGTMPAFYLPQTAFNSSGNLDPLAMYRRHLEEVNQTEMSRPLPPETPFDSRRYLPNQFSEVSGPAIFQFAQLLPQSRTAQPIIPNRPVVEENASKPLPKTKKPSKKKRKPSKADEASTALAMMQHAMKAAAKPQRLTAGSNKPINYNFGANHRQYPDFGFISHPFFNPLLLDSTTACMSQIAALGGAGAFQGFSILQKDQAMQLLNNEITKSIQHNHQSSAENESLNDWCLIRNAEAEEARQRARASWVRVQQQERTSTGGSSSSDWEIISGSSAELQDNTPEPRRASGSIVQGVINPVSNQVADVASQLQILTVGSPQICGSINSSHEASISLRENAAESSVNLSTPSVSSEVSEDTDVDVVGGASPLNIKYEEEIHNTVEAEHNIFAIEPAVQFPQDLPSTSTQMNLAPSHTLFKKTQSAPSKKAPKKKTSSVPNGKQAQKSKGRKRPSDDTTYSGKIRRSAEKMMISEEITKWFCGYCEEMVPSTIYIPHTKICALMAGAESPKGKRSSSKIAAQRIEANRAKEMEDDE